MQRSSTPRVEPQTEFGEAFEDALPYSDTFIATKLAAAQLELNFHKRDAHGRTAEFYAHPSQWKHIWDNRHGADAYSEDVKDAMFDRATRIGRASMFGRNGELTHMNADPSLSNSVEEPGREP